MEHDGTLDGILSHLKILKVRCVIVQLNTRGEVADFLDVSQFVPGRSDYECVAYVCALLKYAGQPGHGPTGTIIQTSNEAQYWYGRIEGSNLASNENGMSLGAEYEALTDMGMTGFHALPITGNTARDLALIKAWLALGYPLAVCGAESGFYDVALGDRVPYSWTPTGNHCIAVSGVDANGHLLVHDCANVDAHGVRPGPRAYDGSLMRLVSATAVWKPWLPVYPQDFDPLTALLEDDMAIEINTPGVAAEYVQLDANHWRSKKTGKVIQDAILTEFKRIGYQAGWGHPLSNEVYYAPGKSKQNFDCAVPGWNAATGKVTLLPLYEPGSAGVDPAIADLEKQLAEAKAAPTLVQNAQAITVVRQVKKLVEPF